ncbi:MAG: methyltransferase domain-containing protein [Ornithinimicrobium sp.]
MTQTDPMIRRDPMTQTSFSDIFAQALQGSPVKVVGIEEHPYDLPVDDWTRHADEADHALLDLCVASTVDIGCGPGRLSSALALRGHVVLGVDIVAEAVDQARSRGASAERRDVFKPMPDEGRWESALLADGNIGIGGNPVALLARAGELILPTGRVVVELRAPGIEAKISWVTLESGDSTSKPFRWAVVGVDDIERIAAEAGLVVKSLGQVGLRWAVVLEHPNT